MLDDLRFAVRALRSAPGFTVVALLVLTLGIGATTAIYSVVDAVALRSLPFDEPHRLVAVEETQTDSTRLNFGGYVAAANFLDWRAQQQVFQDLAAYGSKSGFTLRDGAAPEDLRAQMVTASLFSILRVTPAMGHLFPAAAEAAGADHVALISDGLWRRRFGADPGIVGKTMKFDSGVWEIVGVMPAGFTFPIGPLKSMDLWVPYVPQANEVPRGDGSSRNYNARVIGRLKAGVSIEQARAQMEQVETTLKAQYPRWFRDRWIGVRPLQEAVVGTARSWMLFLLGAVAFVLLIACVNVANLVLARATARARDVSVRAALGATRWQLARGLLAETLVLSCAGTALGVAAAIWGVSLLRASLPPTLPRLSDVGVDLRVLFAAASAALITGVAFGVLPAFQLSRPNLVNALREGGRSGSVGAARQRVRTMLLVSEVALAVVLLIGSGLFVSSFVKLLDVDLGISTANVLTVGVYPKVNFTDEKQRDTDMVRAAQTQADALARVRQLPGVQAVGFTSGNAPLSGGYSRTSIKVGDKSFNATDDQPDVKTLAGDYFRAMGVPTLFGRTFTDADGREGAEKVVIINDVAMMRFFDGANPIGKQAEVSGGVRTVVGVVKAVRLGGPEAPMRPEVYVPTESRGFGGILLIRTAQDPATIVKDVRASIQELLPGQVIPEAQTLDAMFDRLVVQRRFNMVVLALFGGLAIVIAAVGIYGVMAYIVQQRTQEIGVRMALGAQSGQVQRMVLGRAMAFVTMGLAIGLTAGWFLARLVSAFLFSVDAHDPIVYAAAAAILLLAGAIAAFIPARRAARVDPLTALR